jgi:UDP-N-acetylglucosamine 1-carboxyvinyltransferase
MTAAAITRGTVLIENVQLAHMTAVIEKLREIGVDVRTEEGGVRVSVSGELNAVDCIALPYPGIPTDVQAQFMALLATVPGISIVTDKVFPDRFLHAPELVRMGARIRREGASAIISGTWALSGANVMASDLRASAALVLAGMAAKGPSVVRRIYHLDRGYDRLEAKLNSLGAEIERVTDEPANMPAGLVLTSDCGAPERPTTSAGEEATVRPVLQGPNWLKRRSASVNDPKK